MWEWDGHIFPQCHLINISLSGYCFSKQLFSYFVEFENSYKNLLACSSLHLHASGLSFPTSVPQAVGRAPRLEVPFAGKCWKPGSRLLSIPPCALPCRSLHPSGPVCWQPVQVSTSHGALEMGRQNPHRSRRSHAVTFPKPRPVGDCWALEGSRLVSSAGDGKRILITCCQVEFSSLLQKQFAGGRAKFTCWHTEIWKLEAAYY